MLRSWSGAGKMSTISKKPWKKRLGVALAIAILAALIKTTSSLENPILPIRFLAQASQPLWLALDDGAYRRSYVLTISPKPQPSPGLRLPGGPPSHDFLPLPPLSGIRYVVGKASHRHGGTMEACFPRVPVAEHWIWSVTISPSQTINDATSCRN